MVTERFQQCHPHFGRFAESCWRHLSSLTILLIVLNMSLFFLTNLVTKQGCRYTFHSLLGFAIAPLGPFSNSG